MIDDEFKHSEPGPTDTENTWNWRHSKGFACDMYN